MVRSMNFGLRITSVMGVSTAPKHTLLTQIW